MQEDEVVLVDQEDNSLGNSPKLEAHRSGALHRAVSVFVLNPSGQMLLQRRADGKYHSGGLWSNACCTHPRPAESVLSAATRRLNEEMGVECALEPLDSFIYRIEVGQGLIEHEYDHVFVGFSGEQPRPDPAEVSEWRWASIPEVEQELDSGPARFTRWFPLAFRHFRSRYFPVRKSDSAFGAFGR